MDVIAKLTVNPAHVYNLEAGSLKEGGCADICIFDPNAEYVLESFRSKSVNSPFLGRRMKGMVCMTICDGRIIYERSL
jgi:dihydroorotase